MIHPSAITSAVPIAALMGEPDADDTMRKEQIKQIVDGCGLDEIKKIEMLEALLAQIRGEFEEHDIDHKRLRTRSLLSADEVMLLEMIEKLKYLDFSSSKEKVDDSECKFDKISTLMHNEVLNEDRKSSNINIAVIFEREKTVAKNEAQLHQMISTASTVVESPKLSCCSPASREDLDSKIKSPIKPDKIIQKVEKDFRKAEKELKKGMKGIKKLFSPRT